VKLLFDHHLSRKLVGRLQDVFPDASHVVFHGLDQAGDIDIWLFAQQNGFTIITKDSDFNDIITLRGAPPKVIWIRVGNCTTKDIENIIRRSQSIIIQFVNDPGSVILEII
jgi:predicted nuclease of predicted toxin-antitoxin system